MPVEWSLPPRTSPALNGRKRVLIVDDDPLVRRALHLLFDRAGYRPTMEASLSGACQLLGENQIDLVVTDYRLAPGETGFELLGYFQRKRPNLPVIMMSGADEEGLVERAMEAGAYAFFRKPFELSVFLRSCQQALKGSLSI